MQRQLREEEKEKSKLELANNFAKELMEYKKIQKERRRSFSRLVFCKPSQQNYKWDFEYPGITCGYK